MVKAPTIASAESSARRSACVGPDPGLFSVVMSTIRKRKRVTVWPVLLVNRRRMISVPKFLFTPVSVTSRTRLGGKEAEVVGSTYDGLIVALR